jgi:hypothetical protein
MYMGQASYWITAVIPLDYHNLVEGRHMFAWVDAVLAHTFERRAGECVRMALSFLRACTWRTRSGEWWGRTFEDVATMGERAGMVKQNAQRAMRQLEDAGLVVRVGCKRCGPACAGGRTGHPTIRAAAIGGVALERPTRTTKTTKPPRHTWCVKHDEPVKRDGMCTICLSQLRG